MMIDDDLPLSPANDLRKRAEEIVRAAEVTKSTERLSPAEMRRLCHELQVHQIELEMQNEELHNMQGELEASWSQYFDLYDLAPVGYLTISAQGLILKANLTATTLLGVARGALVKQPLTRFILPEDQDIYYLHRKQPFAPGARQFVEIRLLSTEHPFFWALLQITTMQNGESWITINDITERKREEEARQRLQEQLLQAQKMESIGRLAGGMAHEFNNMLSVILGNAELAMKQVDLAQPLDNHLAEIIQAAQRSGKLTRQLLAFARQETIIPKILDLNETVAGMLNILRRLIGEEIDLAWLPGSDLWPVKMDPSQVDQILVNLCINARDAIAGVGKLTIETENAVCDAASCADHAGILPGEYVLLTISDNGSGMDKETLEHIFEPFFTTKKFGQSPGLGLATVYGIVKQSDGFISVYSELGLGTAIKIYLPRQVGQAVEAETACATETPKAGGETVLLVEDEPAVLKMTQRILERQGYVILAANTTDEAIRLAEEHAGGIDLLLTDVVMPNLNGQELAARIREGQPAMKCLFMSGYTADIIAQDGVLGEGVHFIQKPFLIKDLACKVREVLESTEGKQKKRKNRSVPGN